MLLNSLRLALTIMIFAALSGSPPSMAASSNIPAWLQKHVGTGEGQIAPVVLERARALYQQKLRQGQVRNPCYLAKDATRPSTSRNGAPGQRFYVICERQKTFRAVSSGYGNGRKLKRANFSNGRQCAKNFSNAEGSKLTMGGSYVTAETRTSFKGYYSQSGKRQPFHRTFLLFDGEGDTANARERAIGGHPAVFLKWQCRYKNPKSPYADNEGYVPYGKLVNYTGGRSNGCTTWSQSASSKILSLVEGNPTTLYIYPESGDIDAVANAVKKRKSLSRAGLYWNASCLKEIKAPKFWPKRTLQPIINEWRQSLPKQPPMELPICK
ncbi:murein L,D-transpeptidase catalytic domain family protein [Hoeflea sp. WL0058]|uniref:Murein L,D-transpeptidase catalytic domain family protein n=1 Tax=Flavimaribacter sediminis TaxID=2865987 RepID=A0AAE2ZM21_9HYPH|nr:murein L,D-transpeptidase catalytic domain family protein [Flavimaribacter sediminis]MBW8637170.1 murein L,D-transpeptidase catalytic domain family protein [Flavimaribacter sediminis]